jgi:glycosyltransferase involved in cell wall biosynthesis
VEGQTLADSEDARDAVEGAPIAIHGAFRRSASGIGTYSNRLIEGLSAGPFGRRVLPLAPAPGISRTLWLLGQAPGELRRAGAALFHGLANFDLPISKPAGVRFVLTVHDLIPLEWPNLVSRPFRLQFRIWISRSLDLADAVLCPTLAVAKTVRDCFPNAAPARVVPMGASLPASITAVGADRPSYFLALGSVEDRKNLTTLIEAFAARAEVWRGRGIELWIAGPVGFGGERILTAIEAAAGQGVRYLGTPPAAAIPALVRGALVLCAPSLAEGFGLPPLEALALGVPVLASDIAAHREVLGEAAVLLPATQPEAWGEALQVLAADPDLCAQLSRQGLARATAFTWERAIRGTEAVYRDVLG